MKMKISERIYNYIKGTVSKQTETKLKALSPSKLRPRDNQLRPLENTNYQDPNNGTT